VELTMMGAAIVVLALLAWGVAALGIVGHVIVANRPRRRR
jgi:hypothetical protein